MNNYYVEEYKFAFTLYYFPFDTFLMCLPCILQSILLPIIMNRLADYYEQVC